ncbi:hypothetical protein B0H14DRAFT_3142151 [Mycena olivaceomarginata]|nr:hypothetical protein B0H14DRAFT_3142151 [Mycena olivaceomarginata]
MSGAQMANASPAEIARGLITFLGEVSEEERVKVLAALLLMQLHQIKIDLGVIEAGSGSQFDLAKHIFGIKSVFCVIILRKWGGTGRYRAGSSKNSLINHLPPLGTASQSLQYLNLVVYVSLCIGKNSEDETQVGRLKMAIVPSGDTVPSGGTSLLTQLTGASQERRFCIIHLVTAIEDIRFRRPEGPRRSTATNPDRPGSPDTQDEVRIAEDLIVNPEWQRDQDLIDNLESELHQALSRIEEYVAQLQTMHMGSYAPGGGNGAPRVTKIEERKRKASTGQTFFCLLQTLSREVFTGEKDGLLRLVS